MSADAALGGPAEGRPLFDGQAERYERRAALPAGVGRAVARAVVTLSGAEPGDLAVEVGAGTGMVGRWLARPPIRYLGFDVAAGMLAVFRRRLEAAPGERLLACADGDRCWPVADGAARVIFSSRALHLLAVGHVAREVRRVARRDGATLITGRLRFAPDGVRDALAQAMRRRLRQHGCRPRGGTRMQARLIDTLCQRGAERAFERQRVARWSVSGTLRQAIDDWRGKPGLGGLRPPEPIKRAVLEAVESWARSRLGALDRPFETEVAYVLEGVRLPPRAAAGGGGP